MKRQETGKIGVEDDWTGFFLRGDDCLYLALLIQNYITHKDLFSERLLWEWSMRLKIVEENE